jgi:hypothetical protein
MIAKLIVVGSAGLFAAALALGAWAVRRSIARDKALDAAAYARDPQPPTEPAQDSLDAKWGVFWRQRELDYRRSLLPARLVDAENIRPWARQHAVTTAGMFAGYEEDKRHELDDWLNSHLRKLGFASVAEVNAEMERALAETIERMEADVARTDIECTETGSWTADDVKALREYEAAHPLTEVVQ